MNALWLLLTTMVIFSLAYRFYGRRLAKTFGVDPSRATPAHTCRDERDFVPAKHWWVLFGHHFSSICGAGPIIGPILAIAYWGWLPSWLWVVLGAIFIGAVSDFSAIMVSVRSKGESVCEVAKPAISPLARMLFLTFVWISLILVISVFSILAANTYLDKPGSVWPSWGLMPVAFGTGWLLYRTRLSFVWVTVLGISLLVLLLWIGARWPIQLSPWGPLTPKTIWILILLLYAFVASVIPVHLLLQPRDYLSSFLLFAAIGIGVISVGWSRPMMDAIPLYAMWPKGPEGAGPIWPMLFVTIACGAVSGFHAIVSSGTTSKQLDNEIHACRIGYGGMLTEGLVGALVVICAGAALTRTELVELLRRSGPIVVFAEGYGRLSIPFLGSFGSLFAVVALNAFILTTLDTAARIARYLTQELFGIRSIHLATGLVIGLSGWLALSGHWMRVWPAFGTSNQLVAALCLLVASCWLLRQRRLIRYTAWPAGFLLVTTLAAFGFQLKALRGSDPILSGVIVILMALAVVVSFEVLKVIRTKADRV